VTQTVKQAPGQVERTSVAVLLNSSKKVNEAQVKSLVTAAAGLNATNGDQLVVTSMRFASAGNSQSAAASAASASAHREQLLEHAGEIGGLLLLIGAMVAVTLVAAKRRRPLYQEIALGELGPMVSMIPVEEEPNPTGEMPAIRAAPALQLGSDAVLAQVNQFVEQRPAEAAQLLKSWADEREEVDGGRALPV
jgi:flagellar M-ring protein FliF